MVIIRRFLKWKNYKSRRTNFFELCFVALCLHLLLKILFKKEDVFKLLEENILHYNFAGANVCKDFPCFGSALCDVPGFKIKLEKNSVRGINNWLKITGSTINKKGTTGEAVFSIPLSETCNGDVCSVELSKRLFSKESYETWVCNHMGFVKNCNIQEIIKNSKPFKGIMSTNGVLPPEVIQGLSPPLTCVSPRLANRFVRRVLGVQGIRSVALKDYTDVEKAEMIFTSKLSPATVVQKLFPPNEGWLVENALGTCGLVTVTSSAISQTLFELYDAPWKVRLDVAVQLLDLAHSFTENDSKFMLLFHRLTTHDIGISKRGKLRIGNSENIIIVDTMDAQQNYFNNLFEANYDKSRYRVEEESICRYNRSDINYYVVCRYFLSGSWKGLSGETLEGGLLHKPEELGSFRSEMNVLLDLCTRGPLALPESLRKSGKPTRFLAAKKLRFLLSTERECGEQYLYRYPECELYDETLKQGIYAIPAFELQWLR